MRIYRKGTQHREGFKVRLSTAGWWSFVQVVPQRDPIHAIFIKPFPQRSQLRHRRVLNSEMYSKLHRHESFPHLLLNQCKSMYLIHTQHNSYTEYASFEAFNELPCLHEDSMNVLMCDSTTGSLTPLTQLLDTTPDVHIVDVVRNGRDMALALNSKDIHLSVLAPEVLDLDLVVEKSRGFIPMVKKVVVASPPTAPLVIKAHQYGVHDVIPLDIDTASLLQRFQLTIEGKSEIENHPVIKSLKFKNGQFNKIVKHTNDDDVIILQLLSLGMSDSEISLVTEISIQLVRNRIAELIIMNDLANRTQLAVLQATNLVIPDFA